MNYSKHSLESKLDKEINTFIKNSADTNIVGDVNHNITYNEFLSNKMLMIGAIKSGIPYALFDLISNYTPFNENDWANFLDISTKSLQRYKTAATHLFKSIHSEKIIEMAEVTKVGLDVFEDIDKLRLWLNTPNFALGNCKPIELLNDSYGKELVITELIHISHGILI